MPVTIIVAVAENGIIGANGAMPWHIPADLKRFKALTMGKPMVMGRKTFESLPGLLPGRRHIVVTRNRNYRPDLSGSGAIEIAQDLNEALMRARRDNAETEVMVIGGAEVIALALPHADRVELTEIAAAPQGDVRLPPLDRRIWHEIVGEPHPAQGLSPPYRFVTLIRNPAMKTPCT